MLAIGFIFYLDKKLSCLVRIVLVFLAVISAVLIEFLLSFLNASIGLV